MCVSVESGVSVCGRHLSNVRVIISVFIIELPLSSLLLLLLFMAWVEVAPPFGGYGNRHVICDMYAICMCSVCGRGSRS